MPGIQLIFRIKQRYFYAAFNHQNLGLPNNERFMIEQLDSNAVRRQAIAWLVSKQSGAFSAEERQAFERWLAADPDHSRIYRQIEAAWMGLPCPSIELAAARKKDRRLWRHSQRLALAIAASMALAVGLCAWEGWPLADNSVFRTAKGERRNITLADGSSVELNSDSELAVYYSWRGRSLALLRGEALFGVAPGKLRPFEVTAGGGRIRDIGTRFDVVVGASQNRVSVLEGAIDLRLAATGDQRQTLAGQAITYNAVTVLSEPEAADVKALTAWHTGKLIFRNTPLSEVLNKLERYHPVHFRLAEPSLAFLPLGGVFDNNDLERFLVTLEAVLPVDIKRDKNGDVLIDRRRSRKFSK